MRFFEYHFNPEAKQDIVVNTFWFKPTTKIEHRSRGWLYGIYKLNTVLPRDKDSIRDLINLFQGQFYEHDFPQALETVNSFLNQSDKSRVLSDLSLAVAAINPQLELRFSHKGNLPIFLFRNNQVFDLTKETSKNSQANGMFSNVISGALRKNDRILIFTPQLFETFQQNHLLQDLCSAQKPRQIKKVLRARKPDMKNVFGACMLVKIKRPHVLVRKFYLPKVKLPSNLASKQTEEILFIVIILGLLLTLGYLLFG